MKYLPILFVMLVSVNETYGQDTVIVNSLFKSLTLRKSFESKNDKAEAAVITYTNPKEEDESWLLNAAIGINLLLNTSSVITLDPYFEYQKNTLVDKKQDNWQTGLSLEWQTHDLVEKSWSPIVISSLKYNQDRIKDISSFQGNVYFTAIFKGTGGDYKYFWIPNNTVDFGNVFKFVYTPYLGFENENRIQTEADSTSGNIYRTFLRVTSSILLFPGLKNLENRLEFNLDWQYRYNFRENVQSLNKNEHQYFTASFNYVLFTTNDGGRSVKIGIDYINGENPTKGFEDQSFYAVTLKVKM